eukprot:TRINITY_DN4614_c1_g2_i1.p2 TRINITY_DN4614_c1_g2~~TRINITY_DN4614_c1_g2_i1.p2  ORF type:complete len:186 (-),score=46.96 TRINITY_DN4614_c1_g2_i1:23-580(-)
MEFFSGGSLDKLLASNRDINERQRLLWARDIAKGVHHIHTAMEGIQIIHRDLSARNVLLKADMTAAICDFGMSRAKDDSATYAKTKNTFGPLKWMSPESILHSKYSTASDVFSYGVVLYEILSGEMPWRELSNMEAARQVVEGKRLPTPPNANKHLVSIMLRCWEQQPEKRPSTAEIVSLLEKIP